MAKSVVQLSSKLYVRVIAIVMALLFVFAVQAMVITGAPSTSGHKDEVAVVVKPTPSTGDSLPSDEVNGGGVTPIEHSAGGDPVHGEKLFKTFNPKAGIACVSCHLVNKDDRLVGPGLKTIGARAGMRVAGMTAAQYIRQSIVEPAAYVVDGFQPIMPKTFGKAFTEAELDDLVAYLLTLK